ncbi:MAG: T9SS type A sorting domain-containing protein [Prolixibacteraceae bacterium]|nr:T9SS type A sorting domain-containing protein [Prolixibacteraceae bacterium]MBN2775464.1 T9SS type A sorting domain-containing protein [Prolixibacteraceae bacterium]
MKKHIFTFLLFLSIISVSSAQKIGEWKEFLSFSYALDVADGGEKIYCAAQGGLFYYNIIDNSIQKINRLTGLNDFNITSIEYSPENQLLMVAYKNSNIDLIYDNNIINLSDIKRKSIMGDKSINNIFFRGSEAYISCGFGIVVINLEKQEVKDTYLIGNEGSQIAVYDVDISGNTIYAATEEGIYFADINSPNLLDYRNWSRISSIPHFNEKYTEIESFNGNIIAVWNGSEMYLKNGESWDRYLSYINTVRNLSGTENYLTVTGNKIVYIIDQNHQQFARIQSYPGIEAIQTNIGTLSAVYNENTGLWIADYNFGLVKASGEPFESIYPEGPIDNKVFCLYANDNDLWVASGGYNASWDNNWTPPQFQLFREDSWSYFTRNEIPEMGGLSDVVCMIANPADKNHLFVGAWGGGLLEFQNGELLNRYTENNSSLQTAIINQPYVRIGGLDFDSKGNLWVTNADVPDVLSVLYANGEWEAFSLPNISQIKTGKVLVTQNDDKWVVAPRGHNICVVNNDGSQKEYLQVKSYFNNGETELITDMNDIFSIAEDQDGAIWIGTSKGVAVYFNPERIWESEFLYATQPSLDLNDGLYHPLLQTETVTAIAVDGANRKWMGTANSGIYLISANGEEEIHHFTEDNSPLLSNNITSIAINQISGEVFIGTQDGIVSYMGDAIEGHDTFENVLVYPNPVRETYDGPVVITGLMEESDIKITDISGNLVYNTTSLGGQATWDGKNLNGNRVKTGVYLIFLSDKNGEKTHISKLLFIN